MERLTRFAAAVLVVALVSCDRTDPLDAAPPAPALSDAAAPAPVSSAALSPPGEFVADSLFIDVAQPTLIGFHPFATDSMLERDEELATVLDDFGYHLSGSMGALQMTGWLVDTRIADTLHFRAGERAWRWVRPPDSAYVGYVLTDSTGRLRAIFGVRTNSDLITVADSFARASPR